jgi:hypothetical protein
MVQIQCPGHPLHLGVVAEWPPKFDRIHYHLLGRVRRRQVHGFQPPQGPWHRPVAQQLTQWMGAVPANMATSLSPKLGPADEFGL